MNLRVFAHIALFSLVTCLAAGQTPAFLVADVHSAPMHTYPFYFSLVLPDNRYVARDATLVDLIATAYGTDADNVQRGPSWVARDHFDIFAKEPPSTSKADEKSMLKALLTERFHLTFHNGIAPMPAYVMTVSKDKSKLKPGDSSAEEHCDEVPTADDAPVDSVLKCHGMTLDALAGMLKQMASGYLDKPVLNATGLEGVWDLELKWTSKGHLSKAGPDGISLFDAVEKQLGLKLTLETAPRPVLLVDSASRQPTPNVAGMEKLLPPQPLPTFEVATIKPSKPGARGNGNISGGTVDFTGAPLRLLIDLAWDLNENDRSGRVVGPAWMEDEKFDILAKVAPEAGGRPLVGDMPMDIYEVELMLRALLVERFQMKAHMEDRPIDAFTLSAANPKLKPADPSVRTACTEGPGPDGKDPRLANAALNRLLTCRNMSIAELCDELQREAGGYIFNPVLDKTGIEGRFDFMLAFSSADRIPHETSEAESEASTPNGAISLFDAMSHQLGLKLEKQKRALPVLVIDHLEQKPTEN